MQNLGGAKFTISTNVAQFNTEMAKAKGIAGTSTQEMSRGFDRVHKSSRGAAQGLMALGQAVDDIQYGFHSIVNNIPQIVWMMGGGAGMAGAIGITAVAVNQLINHWDQLINVFKSQWLNVPFDQLEKLRIGAEKAGEAVEKLMTAPSDIEAKEIAHLKQAIIEAPHGGAAMVMKGLREAVQADPGLNPLTDEDRTEIARLRREKANIIPGVGVVGDDQIRKLDAQIKVLTDKLDDVVKGILGGALVGGEQGQAGRQKLNLIIEKFKGSFDAIFRSRVKAGSREAIEAAESEKNKMGPPSATFFEEMAARNKMIAAHMMSGPLGTELMLGGGQTGPASAKALQAMMAKSKRRFGAMGSERMLKEMQEAGLTEEQARGVLGGMGPKATFERGKQIRDKLGMPAMAGGQLQGDVVAAAVKELFAEGMKKVAGKPGGITGKIGGAMDAAGAVGDPKGVLQEMKMILEERVRVIMLERGVTAEQARLILLREQAIRAFPGFNRPQGFMSIMQFARGLPAHDFAQRQLQELILIRQALMRPNAAVRHAIAVAGGPG